MIERGALWSQPHHDGSELYVPDPHPHLGGTATVLLRAPHDSGVSEAHVRVVVDAEPLFVTAELDRSDSDEAWFRAEIPVENPIVSYRWLVDGGASDYRWLTGAGLTEFDQPDTVDFRLSTFDPPPEWAADAIVYQIFPDRFAKSTEQAPPGWAIPQEWEDPVVGSGPETPFQFYGGDLDGIIRHLDHIQSLGVNTIYLTPVFPANSNHRYDAASFDAIDPVLGGDEGFTQLSDALHARHMRLIGDLTTNHSGATHEWFRQASLDASAPEAGFYIFDDHPSGYASWLGVRSLPKFNHTDPELRRRLYEGPDSVVARWLRPPGNLDGWRIDVANMTGRHRDVDLNHDVARAIRRTMQEADPEALLIAEHGHDYSRDLFGDGWHGTMNYAGFSRPVWSWLRHADPVAHSLGLPVDLPRLPGPNVVATMRAFFAAIPWQVAIHNLNIISSHDTPRARTILGRENLVVAVGLLATLPGIPMLYAGDEIGLEGANGEDGRRPFPWDPGQWDAETLQTWRRLLGVRVSHPALRRGGLRWLYIGEDVLVFERELPGERILVQARRCSGEPVELPATVPGRGAGLTGLAGTADLGPGVRDTYPLPDDGPSIRLWLMPQK